MNYGKEYCILGIMTDENENEAKGMIMRKMCVKTYEQTVKKPELPAAKSTLAFLTDFHNGKEDVGEDILTKLSRIRPDMVCVGGDMLVGKSGVSWTPAFDFMKKLTEHYPVVYAYGNHEYRMCFYPETYGDAGLIYERELKKLSLTLLRNDSASIILNGMLFRFTGLELPAENYKKFRKIPFTVKDMEKLIGKSDEKEIQVLLAHNPVYSETYLDWKPDLVLSGHMHGGVVRIFGRPVIGTDGQLFPKYGYGRINREGASMYISAGLGEHTIPLRLFNPRELVVVRITNEI